MLPQFNFKLVQNICQRFEMTGYIVQILRSITDSPDKVVERLGHLDGGGYETYNAGDDA